MLTSHSPSDLGKFSRQSDFATGEVGIFESPWVKSIWVRHNGERDVDEDEASSEIKCLVIARAECVFTVRVPKTWAPESQPWFGLKPSLVKHLAGPVPIGSTESLAAFYGSR